MRSWRGGIGTQAIALAGATGVGQLLTVSVYALAARAVLPSQFGEVTTAIALGLTLAGLVDFGSNSYWVREGAAGRMSASETATRAWAKLFVSTVGAAVVYSLVTPIAGWRFALTVALILVATATSQIAYMGLSRVLMSAHLALCILIERTTTFVAYLMIDGRGLGLLALPLSLLGGAAAGATLAFALTPSAQRLDWRRWRWCWPWRGTASYGAASLASSTQSLEIQAIALFGGPYAAGIYTSVNRWTQPMGLLASAFASASMPFVAEAPTWVAIWPRIRRMLWLPLVAMVAASVVALSAPLVVPLILGQQYVGAVPVLQILAVGTVAGVANQILSVFLQARNADRAVGIALVTVAVLQLTLVATFVSLGGPVGAAWASAGLQFLTFVWLAGITLRRSERRQRK